MSKEIQECLAPLREPNCPAIWDEPNLQYDGTEPPKAWLNGLKQLKQIHGYNENETMKVAERCLKGAAQLWFRHYRPTSLEALRTGLHRRFASVLCPATGLGVRAEVKNSAISPAIPGGEIVLTSLQLHASPHSNSPNSSQFDVNTCTKLLTAPSNGKEFFRPGNAPKFFSERQESQVVPNNSLMRMQNSLSACLVDHEDTIGYNKSIVSPPARVSTIKASIEDHFATSDSNFRQRHDPKHTALKHGVPWQTPVQKRSTSKRQEVCSNRQRISARDVLEENDSRSLPVNSETLPSNWQEALLKFKQAIHRALRGDWTQMSTDFCKHYLRCYRMRTSGSKRELIHRIKEHLEKELVNCYHRRLTDGSGIQKYRLDSFVIDCAGNICVGDVILFKQKLQARHDLLNGNCFDNCIRTVVGRVVKEWQGHSCKHAFIVEVYWSKGQAAFCPMRPVRILASDLFILKPLRQQWIEENVRKRLLDEKNIRRLERKETHEPTRTGW